MTKELYELAKVVDLVVDRVMVLFTDVLGVVARPTPALDVVLVAVVRLAATLGVSYCEVDETLAPSLTFILLKSSISFVDGAALVDRADACK